MQSRNRDTDVEKKMYGHQGGKAAGVGHGGVMIWEIGMDMYTLMWIKWITNTNLLYKKVKYNSKNKKQKTQSMKCERGD